jgi:hypothetical protein
VLQSHFFMNRVPGSRHCAGRTPLERHRFLASNTSKERREQRTRKDEVVEEVGPATGNNRSRDFAITKRDACKRYARNSGGSFCEGGEKTERAEGCNCTSQGVACTSLRIRFVSPALATASVARERGASNDSRLRGTVGCNRGRLCLTVMPKSRLFVRKH